MQCTTTTVNCTRFRARGRLAAIHMPATDSLKSAVTRFSAAAPDGFGSSRVMLVNQKTHAPGSDETRAKTRLATPGRASDKVLHVPSRGGGGRQGQRSGLRLRVLEGDAVCALFTISHPFWCKRCRPPTNHCHALAVDCDQLAPCLSRGERDVASPSWHPVPSSSLLLPAAASLIQQQQKPQQPLLEQAQQPSARAWLVWCLMKALVLVPSTPRTASVKHLH